MSLQLTRTETNVNSGNKTFSVTVGGTTYSVTLTEEEVSSGTNLATALQSAIRTATSDNNFTATYSSSTGKITIANSGASFTITVTEGSARLIGLLGTGYRGAGTISSSGGGNSIVGTRNVDLSGTPYIILVLNDYDRVVSASTHAEKSFLVIPMEDKAVGTRFIICGDEKEKKGIYLLSNNQKNIHEMRVKFLRPDGSLYDFKGVDHLITFRVYRNDYHDYNS
jgi:hypothetical protein